jgi:hypothetical protein
MGDQLKYIIGSSIGFLLLSGFAVLLFSRSDQPNSTLQQAVQPVAEITRDSALPDGVINQFQPYDSALQEQMSGAISEENFLPNFASFDGSKIVVSMTHERGPGVWLEIELNQIPLSSIFLGKNWAKDDPTVPAMTLHRNNNAQAVRPDGLTFIQISPFSPEDESTTMLVNIQANTPVKFTLRGTITLRLEGSR